jgi:hypothetical protein
MAEKILEVGIEREEGFLYYMDKDGDISKIKAEPEPDSEEPPKPFKVLKCKIKKAPGYLYYVSKMGDLWRAKMKDN